MAVHKGALDPFDSGGLLTGWVPMECLSPYMDWADLGSGEQRFPFLGRVVQIAIAPMADRKRRTNDRDRGGIDCGRSSWSTDLKGCVGQDLNLRTPTGQDPEPCAFDQAWQPTHAAGGCEFVSS